MITTFFLTATAGITGILVYFYKDHDFLKQIIVLLVTKLHGILLISGISVGTLRPKQKRKMKEF